MKHTASAYRNGSCDCDTCVDDHRNRMRRERQARFQRTEQNGGVAPIDRHGYTTYSNWGCRCDDCSSDHRRVMRQTMRRWRAATSGG